MGRYSLLFLLREKFRNYRTCCANRIKKDNCRRGRATVLFDQNDHEFVVSGYEADGMRLPESFNKREVVFIVNDAIVCNAGMLKGPEECPQTVGDKMPPMRELQRDSCENLLVRDSEAIWYLDNKGAFTVSILKT